MKMNYGEIKYSDIVAEITNDFVSAFQSPADFKGIVARLVASECLPEGVNFEDGRVKTIIRKCKEENPCPDKEII